MSETHSPSLREALEASFAQSESTAPSTPAADAGSTRDVPGGGAAAPGGGGGEHPSSPPAQASDGPQRDAQGRFQAKAGDGASASSGSVEPPEGYDPAVWAMLSPEAREKTVAWAKQQGSKYEPFNGLDRVLTQQRRDALAMQYGGVDKAMEQLFALSDFAARDATGFVRQFAAQRGVDLRALAGMGQPGAPQGQPQPQQHMTPEQALRTIARQEAEQLQQRNEVNRLYDEFASSEAFEHRENPKIREVMAVLLATNQANDYRSAYEMAVRAHPDLGPKWMQAQAASTAKAQQDAAAEAARAKADAAASVVGAPGTTRPGAEANRNSTLRQDLEAAFARQGGARV